MKIEESYNHVDLIVFYISRDLEFSGKEQYLNRVAFSYVAKSNGELVGAITVGIKGEDMILDAVAVAPKYENQGIGTELYNIAIDRIRNQYGDRKIYLVAKNIDFFKHKGWAVISQEEAPSFSDCFTCPEYKKTCFPEIMLLDLEVGKGK